MIRKLMWAFSFIALAGTAFAIQYMPESIPMHYDFAGNVDRYGSRYEAIIFPVMILAMSLFWTLLIRYYENKSVRTEDEKEKAAAATNIRVLEIAGLCMAGMFSVMHGFNLYKAYNIAKIGAETGGIDLVRMTCILLGTVLIILGNFMTKTRINGVVGLRTSWSMYNDNTWRRSNRFGGIAIMVWGVIAISSAAIFKKPFTAEAAALGVGAVIVIASVVYSYIVFKQEKASEKGER